MKKKYKLTVFSRFMIFMLFFAPFAYIGVSAYQGEKPLEKIEQLIGKKEISKEETIALKKKEIRKLEQQLEQLKQEVKVLETN